MGAREIVPISEPEPHPHRRLIEPWLGVAALTLLAIGCVFILLPFMSAALWAAILCYTTWPLYSRLKEVLGGRATLAATIATLLLAAIIIAPVAILVTKLSTNMSELIAASQRLMHQGPPPPPSWVASIPLVGGRLASYWTTLNESSSVRLAEIAKLIPIAEKFLLGRGLALGEGVLQIILSLVLVFLLYRDGETAAARLVRTVDRIAGEHGRHLLDIAGTTIRAVVYGVLGTALLQGVLAAIGFMIAGVPGAALLGFLTFVLATVPGGPVAVALPAIFWLYRNSSTAWIIFMIVWALIVGSLDTLLRPFLISLGGGNTPLILIILGVLGGAMAFGIIGLFLGPTLLAVAYSLFTDWTATPASLTASDSETDI
jgi:predicted PurR-regulated permease PerM